jgi:hypothetical protein
MARLELTDFERDELQKAYNGLCSAEARLKAIDGVVIGINGFRSDLETLRKRLAFFAFPHTKELD